MDQALSVNTYVYEAIQRKYRNAVVRQIRKTLAAKYGEQWEQEVIRPFKKDWDRIKANADLYRQTGEVSTPLVDALDYLGVNHFYNLFDRHFDVIFAGQAFPRDIAGEPKNAILRWSKSIRNARDPVSHPAETDLSILDAIQAVDCARRVVQVFDKKTGGEIRHICMELMNREKGDSEPTSVLEDTLPPPESIVADFVGRAEELEGLYAWFHDPRQRRWLLAGAGGRGKTAIAYRFATQIKNSAPEPYTHVLWVSAKRRRFMDGAIAAIDHPDFQDLESAVNKLLVDYGWSDSIGLSLEEKSQLLLQLLNQFPTLLVVDDIDTLQEEEDDAVAFFTFEAPLTESKVLYTSRSRFPGMNRCTTVVSGFNLVDAKLFIENRMKDYAPEALPPNDDEISKIRDVTEGSPLYIDELLRLHAMGIPLADCVAEWKEHGERAREFSLRREFELLDEGAKKVLLACCINRQPSTVADLEVVTRLPRGRVVSTIDELRKLFLVPGPQIIEGVPQFDVNPNTRMLVIDVMAALGLYGDIESAFLNLRGEIVMSGKRRADVKAYLRQTVAHAKTNRHSEAEQLLKEKALSQYPNDPDLLGQCGWLYSYWQPKPRVEDARRHFERAASLKCAIKSMYWHWWRMEADRYNWAMAVKAAQKGLENCGNPLQLQYCLGYAHSRFGRALETQFQFSRAQAELEKARSVLGNALRSVEQGAPTDDKLSSQIRRSLVLTCEALMGHVEKGESFKTDTLMSRISRVMRDWAKRHPHDEFRVQEQDRLERQYPELNL